MVPPPVHKNKIVKEVAAAEPALPAVREVVKECVERAEAPQVDNPISALPEAVAPGAVYVVPDIATLIRQSIDAAKLKGATSVTLTTDALALLLA
jgi:hypothetical protein